MTPMSTTPARARRRHDDAPDTAADFERLAAASDGPERDLLAEELVAAWLPMAHRLASRYRNRGESLDDLKQVAAVGLVKAVDRYDPQHGGPFEPCAIPTIVGELRRYFRDYSWDVHVPRRVQELRNKVRATLQELAATEGADRTPTVAQIAGAAGMNEEDVLTGMEAMDSFRSLSLDVELTGSDDGYSLADTLGRPEARYETVIAREAVKPCLHRLPEREQHILYLRFFRDMTQAHIAEELGISQMHVSRLISRSCRTVREEVEADPQPQRLPAAA
ncbi:SigB/SigF/SigG family RNA polymerase sigma factor [Streptomyces botrytidirepellens]|uniref:SigB/SigF/SigG family RNA polymerase sigma factor n=2 Tax=Streptomyces botrytidirepellens TaxID=2486417 RepID=A0A3M8WFB5_9ACTN|nr:SigB/SigF/SigG family RNA polymerase sigma factor [Streptomyces botrytidirepellens]RNG28786.1 SigB/SigF/SigG family RNA polymerase sigma factor [Streptomyces botrytidirepellens]